MRFCWIDAGNDADWQKLAANGINGAFYPASDPVLDVQRRLQDTKNRGLQGGIYAAWNWVPNMQDGAAFAQWVSDRLKLIAPVTTPSWPKVSLDNEDHGPDVILSMLRKWRELHPRQDTSWTLEGMQGGWMSAAFVAEVVALRIRVVPQLYNGAMTQVWDSLANARDLTKRGFPDALISPFYDAAHLPVMWDGFAFTQGRLP